MIFQHAEEWLNRTKPYLHPMPSYLEPFALGRRVELKRGETEG